MGATVLLMASARLCSDGRVTIPKDLRDAAGLRVGTEFDAELTDDGILLRPRLGRDADQWWFWTEEWQAKELEAEADIAAGRHGPVFSSGEEFLTALRELAGLGPGSDSTAG